MLASFENFLNFQERSIQHRRRSALLRIKVRIARAHGQSIRLADNRASDNLDREVQVAYHAPNDGQLRGIFLAKERCIGLNNLEELRDNRGHATEVPRARLPAELVAKAFD